MQTMTAERAITQIQNRAEEIRSAAAIPRRCEFWGVNCNPDQKSWTLSPKQYAHIYIDDAAFGCPMRPMPRMRSRDAVNWEIVGPAVLAQILDAK